MGGTYRSEAVCSMPVTFVITAKLSSGTFSHALNAVISCRLISFPGRSAMYSYGPSMIFSLSADHVAPLNRNIFLLALLELVLLGGTGSDLCRMCWADWLVWSLLEDDDIHVPSGTGFNTGLVGDEVPLMKPVEEVRTGMAFGDARASVTIF
jgi:hypothetical protein